TLAGVVAIAEFMHQLLANHITSLGCNPLSCAAGLAHLRYVLDHVLLQNARKVGEQLSGRLRKDLDGHQIVGDVRGKGLMLGVELVRAGGKTPAPEIASQVLERCRADGLLIGKGGLYGNVLRIAPPMTLTSTEA